MNRAARLIINLPSRVPTTSSLIKLHWLPLKARIEFKLSLLTFKALKFNQPSYIRELCLFPPMNPPWVCEVQMTLTVYMNLELFGERGLANRSFSYIAPPLCNKLPVTIKLIDSLNTFKSHLKAFLFSRAYDKPGLTVQEDYAL